jgi:hypothetical protein
MAWTTPAERLRRGDWVAIGRGIYQVRLAVRPHPAGVRVTFHSGERMTVRPDTEVLLMGHGPLAGPPRRPRAQ